MLPSDMPESTTHYSPPSSNETGRLEKIDNGTVCGWAYDKRTPQTPCVIEIFVDQKRVGTTVANRHRPDLEQKVGVRGGHLAFRFPLPQEYKDISLLQVSARIEGSSSFLEKKKEAAKTDAAALIGKEGWLYLCKDTNHCIEQYIGSTVLSEMQLEAYSRIFTQRATWFESIRIPHIFCIIPGKEYIYPEYLPDTITPGPRGSAADQIIAHQSACGGYQPVNLRPALLAAKPHGQLYYKQDTHWNSIGAFFAAAEIIRRIRSYLPATSELRREEWDVHPAPRVGLDLHGKTHMQWEDGKAVPLKHQLTFEREPTWHLLPAKGLDAVRVPTPKHLQISPTRESIVYEKQRSSLPTALFIHDSYTEWMKPYLSECFRRSMFLWQTDLPQEAIEQEKPDIVVQCRVDRFMAIPPKL